VAAALIAATAVVIGVLQVASGEPSSPGPSAGSGEPAPAPTPDAVGPDARTLVSLTFDDAAADQRAAADTLRANGLTGTFYVPSGSIGQPGALSLDDLSAIHADGNEIGGQTVNRRDLTQVAPDEALRQICDARAQLSEWGFPQSSFANPYGATSDAIAAAVAQCGYNSARVFGGGVNAHPAAAPYALDSVGPIDDSWTLEQLESAVTGAEQTGGWLILSFRHICEAGCDPESNQTISPELFALFAQWLAEHVAATPATEVHAVGVVVGGPVAAPVQAPAPAQPGGALANGSLEDSQIQNVPTCWSAYSYGENAPIYGPSRIAYDGQVAETITMHDYRDGDAKILPTFDTGSCTPAAEAGRSYELGAWYFATVPTQIVAYYRTATGGFAYLSSSPYFGPSSTYRHASWTTPPLPEGATGLSFGLSIFADGSLTTDGYTMSPAG